MTEEKSKIYPDDNTEYEEYAEINKKQKLRPRCTHCGCPLTDKDERPLKINEKGEPACINCTSSPSELGTAKSRKGTRR